MRKRQAILPLEQYAGVVWLQTAFLGDVILTTAAMGLVQKLAPHLRQNLVTTPVGAAALTDHPHLHKIFAIDKRRRGVWRQLRHIRTHLSQQGLTPGNTVLLLAHRSFRSGLFGRFLGLPMVAYAEVASAWLATATCRRVAVFHECARLGMLLEPLGVERAALVASRPFLPAAPLSPALQGRLDPKACKIALAPGSVWKTKQWVLTGYAALLRKILTQLPHGVVR